MKPYNGLCEELFEMSMHELALFCRTQRPDMPINDSVKDVFEGFVSDESRPPMTIDFFLKDDRYSENRVFISQVHRNNQIKPTNFVNIYINK